MATTSFALPNQLPILNRELTKKVMLSDLKVSVLMPTGCFCAGGSMCCNLGDDINCNYGICGMGA
ncbi:uncharacterized protein F4807DRAFT_442593 [Annulohypoxylon truncatum]|uniref:uncharacterized protein n=1 Tax=Annulohypoxylon truncatum TaxID=327061 RepID=UPI0020085683|nr:uncharacterized protein F4807DRAFT_442593 [Annulohypoxylon truncatum]KAI1205651.1 hypothetical protein F4807DRAFT_442593 [Annulohypoxylon truncatum]